MRILLTFALAAAATLAGCLHADDVAPTTVDDVSLNASGSTLEKIEAVAGKKPLKFAFPGQQTLDRAVLWINGTVGPEAAGGYEFPGNRGGTSYGTTVLAEDVSRFLPPGQPALIDLRVWWTNGPGRGVKIDPYIEVPGTKSSSHRGYQDEWTWTLPVKNASVVTAGEAGVPARIGVEVANGKIAPGQQVSYTVRAEFTYAKDVLTPKTPWAVDVPRNATGLILGSVKSAGDRHVAAKVLVVGPDDELVAYVDYNDLAIPTESVFVPIRQPGEHVVYAVSMSGGFLDVRTDAGLDAPLARPLAEVVTETILVEEPAAPGLAAHYVAGQNVTQPTGGVERRFAAGPQFPLEIEPILVGAPAVVGDADLRVLAGSNLIARYHRFLRVDDERGRIGVSDEEEFANRLFHPQFLAKGELTLHAVIDGSTAKAGVRVLTYAR